MLLLSSSRSNSSSLSSKEVWASSPTLHGQHPVGSASLRCDQPVHQLQELVLPVQFTGTPPTNKSVESSHPPLVNMPPLRGSDEPSAACDAWFVDPTCERMRTTGRCRSSNRPFLVPRIMLPYRVLLQSGKMILSEATIFFHPKLFSMTAPQFLHLSSTDMARSFSHFAPMQSILPPTVSCTTSHAQRDLVLPKLSGPGPENLYQAVVGEGGVETTALLLSLLPIL